MTKLFTILIFLLTSFNAFALHDQREPSSFKPIEVVTPPGVPEPKPFEQKGNEVNSIYHQYVKRLEKDYSEFKALLKKNAPSLYRKLNLPPPKPVRFGYQILPKIVETNSQNQGDNQRYRAHSVSYSWAKTEYFIQAEAPKLDEFEEKMRFTPKLSRKDRSEAYKALLTDYQVLEENQRTIDSHIQYNAFWQKAIYEDKERFEHLTHLHDLAVQRQKLLDQLDTEKDPETIAEIHRQEKDLLDSIHSQFKNISIPSFVKIKHPGTPPKANVWVFEVPMVTDIQNDRFIARFKHSIEKTWYVENRDQTYKVKLSIRKVSPSALYTKASVPRKGSPIDVMEHIERFHKKFGAHAGILTTGSNSTYAIPGYYIVLGPQETTTNILAHEFGHILGFIDGYFRGFRDLGSSGYEVLEIVPDPQDIMSTPANGKVLKSHFEKMINSKARTDSLPQAQNEKEALGQQAN